ncbi:right-handed parallel beta-helix repeat-containing protein [archaeon]|nr:right-handed parallel beta-helix repeat-containing protein [archaeon]
MERIAYLFVALTMVLASVYLVGSVTRTINDSMDNKETLIRNSNGNYWEPTTTNIQIAIDDLGTQGGSIWLPSGTFIITQTIQLDDNINLIGKGKSTIIKLGNNAETDLLKIHNSDNVVIRDIFFDGNEAGQSPPPHYGELGIVISGSSSYVTIQNCYFKDIVASHIDAQEGTSFITVDSCHFEGRREWSSTNAGYGGAIWFSGQNNVAKNNFIKDTYACGIVFEALPENPPASGIADGNIITGNICHGIHMENNVKSANVIISNNYLYDLGSDAYEISNARCWGINLEEGSIAANNVVDGVRSYAKGSYCLYGINGNTTIEGNTVQGCEIGIIRYHGNKSSKIIGNSISDMIKYGVYCGGYSDNTVVVGNTVENVGSHGIYLLNGRQNCIVTGNIVSNTGSHGIIEADTSDYNIITSNIARGETIHKSGSNTIKENNIEG